MTTRHAFISAHNAEHSVRRLCAVGGVARSRFYAGRHAAARRAEHATANAVLVEAIKMVFEESRRRYGAPRVRAALTAQGWRVSRRRVANLMKENRLRPDRRRRRPPITTNSRHSYAIAPNRLGQRFDIDRPDAVWLADISYIPTDEGWLYLAAIKDMATREIIGWSMSERLKSTIAEEALTMAIMNRNPRPGLIHHSDRGVQYACGAYRTILQRYGMIASMSRKGQCLDNAPMESFFAALKTELVHGVRFRTRAEARAAVFEYIEIFYNRRRSHSALDYRTPAQARADMTLKLAA